MAAPNPTRQDQPAQHPTPRLILVCSGLLVFCGLFLFLDQVYYRFIAAHFPDVGTSAWLATAFGVVSRAHWILLITAVAILRPRLLGLRLGDSVARSAPGCRFAGHQPWSGRWLSCAERRLNTLQRQSVAGDGGCHRAAG